MFFCEWFLYRLVVIFDENLFIRLIFGSLVDCWICCCFFIILLYSFGVFMCKLIEVELSEETICLLLAFVFRKIYPFPQINSQLPVISLFLTKVDRGLTIPPLSSFIKEERRGFVWSLPLVLTCPAFKMTGGFKRSASPSP